MAVMWWFQDEKRGKIKGYEKLELFKGRIVGYCDY